MFFALVGRNDSCNARVWLLSPHKLNNYSLRKLTKKNKNGYWIFPPYDFDEMQDLIGEKDELRLKELMRKYCIMDFKPAEDAYPLAIYPPHLDERMAAQQACFTIFGNIVRGLNITDAEEVFIEAVVINANSKEKILAGLRSIGISNYSVYPILMD